MALHPVLLQAMYYGIVLLLGFFTVAFFQRDFFYPFLRVRLSFGKYVLVKLRNIQRDYCRVGRIEDGNTLVVNPTKGKEIRLVIPEDAKIVYRFMGVSTVDIDEKRNAFGAYDYSAVTGYDAERFNDLLKRALKKPTLNDPVMKFILVAAIIGAIAAVAGAFIAYKGMASTELLKASVQVLTDKLNSGTVIGGAPL